MLTLDKFEEASEIVKKATQETKLIYSKYFSEQTGNKVYLKPENMQTTGAYKVRGAYYKISTLSEEERQKDHGLRRKSCTGRCLCSKRVWCKGSDRYADDYTADQSKSYQELRCRSGSLWRCL